MSYVGIGIAAATSFTIANFLWQAFTDRAWGLAVERSYFQAVAIFFYMAVLHFRGA